MAKNELYQIHKVTEHQFKCLKFDMDFTPKGGYEISIVKKRMECSCYASNRPTCRHRQMLALSLKEKKINGGWYYDFDRGEWHSPAIDLEM